MENKEELLPELPSKSSFQEALSLTSVETPGTQMPPLKKPKPPQLDLKVISQTQKGKLKRTLFFP